MKKEISKILILVMILQIISENFVSGSITWANEVKINKSQNALEYSIYSGNKENDFAMYLASAEINGSVHTNKNFRSSGSKIKILENLQTVGNAYKYYGQEEINKIIENAEVVEMRYITSIIKDKIDGKADVYNGYKGFYDSNTYLENSILVNGNLNVATTEFTAKDVVYATEGINLSVGSVCTNVDEKVIFCSENGDINISTSNLTIKGVLYAPNGKVKISAGNVKIEGRIIAKDVQINCSNLNVISDVNDFDAVNEAPVVNAGEDKEINISNECVLNGSATDDGLINETLDITWKQVAGESQAEIEDIKSLSSKVNFNEAGTYEFELIVSDGRYTVSDKIIVNVIEDAINKIYTTDEDFNLGDQINIKVENNQVQIDDETKPFNFIWVAVSSKGTVVKINTDTGEVVGEYRTAPSGQPTNPSRTTVDHKGNVWVANRDGNSVIKIGLEENGEWIDKNGNGVCDTSTGAGDILSWSNLGSADTNGGVSTAEDECIIQYVRTSSSGTRHVSVDADNNVWVSGTGNRKFDLIDGETGKILRTEGSVGYGGYGGLIDKNGVIWSARPFLRWDTSKSLSGPNGINWSTNSYDSYGMAIDPDGNVWVTSYNSDSLIRKYSPDGKLLGSYNQGSRYAQGVVCDKNGDVWIAHGSYSKTIGHLKNDGTYVGTVNVGDTPTGVAVDAKGKIWVTNRYSKNVIRIDPNEGSTGNDGVTKVGKVDFDTGNLGGELYNYSDMTGSTLMGIPQVGTWTTIFDSENEDTEWGRIRWDTELFNDGKIEILVSSSEDKLKFSAPVTVQNGESYELPKGRYLKVEVRLTRSSDGKTPIVKEIEVGSKNFKVEKPINSKPEITLEKNKVVEVEKTIELLAEVKDDYVNNLGLTCSWEVLNDEENVEIEAANQFKTNVKFNKVGTYNLRFTVNDGEFTESSEITVKVEEKDITRPEVKLTIDKKEAGLDEIINIKIEATDNIEVKEVGLKIDNEDVVLDENNCYEYITNKVGTISIHGFAIDEAGNIGDSFDEIIVHDTVNPVAELIIENENPKIGETLEIKFNATDNVKIKSTEVLVNKNKIELNKDKKYVYLVEDVETLEIELIVTDTAENKTVVSKTISVQDTIKPHIELEIDKSIIDLDEEVIIRYTASDNRGLKETLLKVDGKIVEIDKNGIYVFKGKEVKEVSVEAIAMDLSGNESKVSSTIKVRDSIVPEVDIALSNEKPKHNEELEINVQASDNIGIDKVELKVNGNKVELLDGNKYIHIVNSDVTTLEATVWDAEGNSATIKKTIYSEDGIKPEAEIIIDNLFPYVGEVLNLSVNASDNIGIKNITLKINGEVVKLDSNYKANYRIEAEGFIYIEAIVEDYSENTTVVTGVIKPIKEFENPTLEFNLDKEDINANEEVEIKINAKDNVAIKDITVKVDGNVIEKKNDKYIFMANELGEHIVEVTVVDYCGNSVTKTKTVNVSDSEKPQVDISFSKDVVTIGEEVNLKVLAKDNYKLKSVEIKVDGNPIELVQDDEGYYIHTIKTTKGGVILVEVKVVDEYSNEAFVSKELKVIANQDAPYIDLTNYGELSVITEPTDIIGIVKDDDLVKYTIEYSPKDKDVYTLISEGTTEVLNSKLGTIDPTLMENGLYDIRLTAIDAAGHKVSLKDTYQVDGDMKVGNFTLGFEDINIPVNGLPISVIRNYDSRDKLSNDFGIGWSLGLTDIKVEITTPIGEEWYQQQNGGGLSTYYEIFETKKHKVLVKYPNGKVDEFNVKLSPQTQKYSPIRVTNVNFEAVKGNNSTLKVVGDNTCNIVGQTVGGLGQLTLAPEDDILGVYNPTKFELTTKDGTKYIINLNGGIEKITYTTGDYVTINKDGITHSSGKKVQFVRDSSNGNRITSITDFTGNKVEYKYDDKGDLVEVIDLKGNPTEFTYNKSHGLVDIINANGVRVTRNEYDDNGRIIAHIDAEGNRVEYNFDHSNRQYIIKDRLGNIEIYNYDSKGNVVSYTDKENNTTKYTYDENDNLISEIDPLGNESTTEYDIRDNLLWKADAYGNKVEGTYNKYGEVLTIKDVNGNVVTNTYDDRGLLTQIEDPYGNTKKLTYTGAGLIETTTDEIGQVVKYTYDSNGNPKTMTNEAGNVTTFVYDEKGNCTSKSMEVTTVEGKEVITISYTYDNNGNKLSATDNKGNTITYEYDNLDQLVAQTDRNNNRVTYEYDVFGNLTKINYPNNMFETFVYDAEGNNIYSSDSYGRVTAYTYDKMGRMTSKTYPNGLIVSYVYDTKGQVIETNDSTGNITTYEYDNIGRNTAIVNALNERTEFVYNKDRNVVKVIDAKNNITEYEYDKLGRNTKVILNEKYSVSWVYDKLGRVSQQIDQKGNVTKYNYDELGNLIKVTDALINETSYKYNEAGNLIEELDTNGNATKYGYDSLGRVVSRTLPLGQSESYEYDNNGNTVKHIDFEGNTTLYEYNSNNLLTKKILSDNSTIEYVYDNNGLLVEIKDSTGSTSYEYDSIGNLIVQTNPNGEKLEYSYDLIGNITTIKTPNTETNYIYDILGRLKTVKDKNNIASEYSYDEVGNLIKITNSNGSYTTYEYDDLYRLINLKNAKENGEILSSYSYKVDELGFRTEVVDHNGRIVNYVYDACGRLLSEKVTKGDNVSETSYTYDKVGNRLTKTSGNEVVTYVYDENNRLVSEDDIQYKYDNNGNLVKKDASDETIEYSYDVAGKLSTVRKITAGKTETESYKYSATGARIQKVTNDDTINYLVDENTAYARVLEESDSNNNLIVSYTYGHDLISQSRSGNVSLYYKDGLGSTTALTNVAGEVTDTYIYDAFGNILEKTGNTENSYLFAGEQLDNLTGQYYLRARYMDSSTGRFTTMDKYLGRIEDPTSIHKYLYAHANPVNYTDPSGYFTLVEQSTALSIQGIISNIATINYMAFLKFATIAVGSVVIVQLSQYVVADLVEDNISLREIINELVKANNLVIDHGNSKRSKKPQHGYEIYNIETGDIVKVGISGGKIRKDGKSYRAEKQVRKFNREADGEIYASRIVAYMPDRISALIWEVQHTNEVYDAGNSLKKHKRPWPINKTKSS